MEVFPMFKFLVTLALLVLATIASVGFAVSIGKLLPEPNVTPITFVAPTFTLDGFHL